MKIEKMRMQNVSVRENEERILNNISFTIYEDEITCLFVPNPTERSALLSLLTGKMDVTKGYIYFDGNPVEKIGRKIHVVRRENQLVTRMNIAENLFLTSERIYSFGNLKRKEMYVMAHQILHEAHLGHMSPKTPIYLLTAVEKNYIELLKAVSSDAKVLVLEDITGIYRPYELERLKRLLYHLKDRGTSVVYITDKKTELLDMIERMIFIWKGMTMANVVCESNAHQIVTTFLTKRKIRECDEIQNNRTRLKITDDQQTEIFSVKEGEVLGVYDEMWAKASDLVKNMQGKQLGNVPLKYEIYIKDKKISLKNYHEALQEGIVFIEEETQNKMIFYNMGLLDNITMMADKIIMSGGHFLNRNIQRFLASEVLEILGYSQLLEELGERKRLPRLNKNVEMIIMIARMLCVGPQIFAFVNPRLSFDDMTLYQFQNILERLKEKNISCVIFSRHLSELEDICDRVISL